MMTLFVKCLRLNLKTNNLRETTFSPIVWCYFLKFVKQHYHENLHTMCLIIQKNPPNTITCNRKNTHNYGIKTCITIERRKARLAVADSYYLCLIMLNNLAFMCSSNNLLVTIVMISLSFLFSAYLTYS